MGGGVGVADNHGAASIGASGGTGDLTVYVFMDLEHFNLMLEVASGSGMTPLLMFNRHRWC